MAAAKAATAALVYVGPQPPQACRLSEAATADNKRLLHAFVAIWMKIFRHCRPGASLSLSSSLSSPLFFYLISFANGNLLGGTVLEGIVVVTKRNGENPSVRTSAFFLYFSPFFFLLPAAFQVQSAAGGKKKREKK